MKEIFRVLTPKGVVYLGLGNRLGVIEPHYRLPFLSWLPYPMADAYVRTMKKGDRYHERFKTIPGLQKMAGGLYAYDYSFSIIAHPEIFASSDMVGNRLAGAVRKVPGRVRRAAEVLIPTVIWVASKTSQRPAGPALAVPPSPVVTKLMPD